MKFWIFSATLIIASALMINARHIGDSGEDDSWQKSGKILDSNGQEIGAYGMSGSKNGRGSFSAGSAISTGGDGESWGFVQNGNNRPVTWGNKRGSSSGNSGNTGNFDIGQMFSSLFGSNRASGPDQDSSDNFFDSFNPFKMLGSFPMFGNGGNTGAKPSPKSIAGNGSGRQNAGVNTSLRNGGQQKQQTPDRTNNGQENVDDGGSRGGWFESNLAQTGGEW